MWILDSDGDVFGGRKIWLRPGKSYLFGRTKSEPGPDHRELGNQKVELAGSSFTRNLENIIISDKSVSRKHLTITVSSVQPGSGTNAYTRSKVTLTDDSKIGTSLNGEKFCKQSRTLGKSTEHQIQLGSFSKKLRVTWRKVGFSFSFSTKQAEREDVLAPFRDKLEPLDIKTYLDYLGDETTFLVSNKRNIPKGLQALISGHSIVKEEYIDQVVAKATSPGVASDGAYLPSQLEEDIDQNWPDAKQYVPDSGKEPVPRPAKDFFPNASRINIFEDFTFIFGEEGQYTSLMPAITTGGAKCLLYPIEIHETSVSDFVSYMNSVGGKKGGAANHDRSVIFVRISRKGSDDDKDWIVHFIRDVDAQLRRESIEQNEFLDAILQNNAEQLIRVVTEPQERATAVEDQVVATRTRARTQQQIEIDPPASTAPTSARRRGIEDDTAVQPPRKTRRLVAHSRFKGFDDFDASQIPKFEPPSISDEEPSTLSGKQSAAADTSQSLFISDSPPGNNENASTGVTTRAKRGRAASMERGNQYDSNAVVDSLVPNANAYKKRRVEERGGISQSREQSEEPLVVGAGQQKQAKVERELDVRSHALSHAKTLDAKSRYATSAARRNGQKAANQRAGDFLDEDNTADPYEDISPEEMHRLQALAIEEFDIPTTVETNNVRSRNDSQRDIRWNPAWNGRKNFKGFKKAGDTGGRDRQRNVVPQTFIAMVDAKAKNLGVGQAYLDDDDEDGTMLSRGDREDEEQEREEDYAMMDGDANGRRAPSRSTQSTSQRQSSASNRVGGSGSGGAARTPPPTSRTSSGSRGKSTSNARAGRSSKSTRQSRLQAPEDEDDSADEEDEMRFRRKRR